VTTIAEFLDDLGYETAGFIHNRLGGSMGGLDQGYDQLFEKPAARDFTEEDKRQGLHTLLPFFNWLDARGDKTPFYAYIHTTEPHHPYQGTFGGGESFAPISKQRRGLLNSQFARHRGMMGETDLNTASQEARDAYAALGAELTDALPEILALYDGDVRRADERVGRVITALRRQGVWDDTLFIVLADHGEEFYEHGNWFHDQSLHGELIHVPLVMHLPGGEAAGRRVARPAQLIDVGPTLADLLGEPPPPLWLGRSLLADIRGHTASSEPTVSWSQRFNVDRLLLTVKHTRGDKETARLEGRLKAVLYQDVDKLSLYDVIADPGETHDLAAERPAEAARVREQIDAWLGEQARRRFPRHIDRELDDEMWNFLIELGYIDRDGH